MSQQPPLVVGGLKLACAWLSNVGRGMPDEVVLICNCYGVWISLVALVVVEWLGLPLSPDCAALRPFIEWHLPVGVGTVVGPSVVPLARPPTSPPGTRFGACLPGLMP